MICPFLFTIRLIEYLALLLMWVPIVTWSALTAAWRDLKTNCREDFHCMNNDLKRIFRGQAVV